jgi:type VI secretion system protein ImpL
MPANPALDTPEPEGRLRWGLYQGEVIGTSAAQTYRAALNQRFLPRLLLRLEEQITANVNEPDVLYEALKVYMMLGLEGPMNADLVKAWMALDWQVSFPGPQREEFRADLSGHLDALLGQPMQKIELNGPLVEQVQGILAEMPLAQRVYNGILGSDAATSLPQWRLTDVGGPAIGRVFIRSSGKALNDGIEGIFTHRGFNDVFLGEALGVAERIQRDSWVLGPRGESEQSELALARLSRDVLDLYYNDYISRYDTLLGDIDIVPLESLAHAVEVTNVLSGPTSPIVNVLDAVAQETRLTERGGALGESELGQAAQNIVGIEAEGALSIQERLLLEALARTAQAEGGPPPAPPGTFVEERFAWLHALTERVNGQPSQLDELMGRLTEVYQELNRMSFSGVTGPDGGGALVRFQEVAARIDGPVPRWASQIAAGSSGITAEGTRAAFDARWKASVLPFCQQVTENRYPFNRRAQADVSMTDFTRLFGPSGLIDAFFQENLVEHVDRSTRPWTWRSANGTDLGISQQVLEELQRAHDIKEAFFPGGGGANVQFQITPEALDPSAEAMTLEIDGQSVSFAHRGGLPTPLAVRWPGPVGLARVVFEPPTGTTENVLSRDGPWAAFRLFDAAEVRNTNVADRKRVIFNVGGRIAIFQMQTGSVLNPFALPALAQFNCPGSF